jgi:SAM-dependent methyltransferase
MNARQLGFPADTFDLALCGFMGWDDCFDFKTDTFTRPATKAPEILRVLKPGGRFACCSWLAQDDLAWTEETVLRHFPAMRHNQAYLAEAPIGMAYEKPQGYEIILDKAGFREIEVATHTLTCLSTDEDEFWQQMLFVGWQPILDTLGEAEQQGIKDAVLKDLQAQKGADGIIFDKTVFFVCAQKS